MRSWRECHHPITAGEATETQTSPGDLPHCAIGEAGADHLEDGVDLLRGGAPPLDEKDIGARVHDVIVADLEIDVTDLAPSPQVIIVVTDIEATQSLQKGRRKATRRVEEGMNNGFVSVLVQMTSYEIEGICLCGRIKNYSLGSYILNQVSHLFSLSDRGAEVIIILWISGYWFFWTTPSSAQGLFLALHSGIIPGRLGGPYGVPVIKTELSVCQTSALPAVLHLWSTPPPPFLCTKWTFRELEKSRGWHL